MLPREMLIPPSSRSIASAARTYANHPQRALPLLGVPAL